MWTEQLHKIKFVFAPMAFSFFSLLFIPSLLSLWGSNLSHPWCLKCSVWIRHGTYAVFSPWQTPVFWGQRFLSYSLWWKRQRSFFMAGNIYSWFFLNLFPQEEDKLFTGLRHVVLRIPLNSYKTNLNNRRKPFSIWPYLVHTEVRLWFYRKWGTCGQLVI